MSPKKASQEKSTEPSTAGGQPDPALNDLEAHISQRINQLQDDGSDGSTDASAEFSADSGAMPAFEPFEGYEFAALHGGPEASYTGGYEKVREVYHESGEVIKSLHNLNDQLTESLLNLNVRLNDMEEKLKELAAGQIAELQKVKWQIKEVVKAIPSAESLSKTQSQQQEKDHPVVDYMNELQKQVTFLKERMDRNVVEMSAKSEERQTAFLNMLDTRVKVMERLSLGYKESLSRNFFNLAILLIIIVIVAGVLICGSVDRMSGFVSQQLDALRTAVHEAIETPGHSGLR